VPNAVAAIKPSTPKVVHPFDTRFPTPPSNFPPAFPARELFHRPFDVVFFIHSGVVDVLLEARNHAWAFGNDFADELMQRDMMWQGWPAINQIRSDLLSMQVT
jgi:hypothetical protein